MIWGCSGSTQAALRQMSAGLLRPSCCLLRMMCMSGVRPGALLAAAIASCLLGVSARQRHLAGHHHPPQKLLGSRLTTLSSTKAGADPCSSSSSMLGVSKTRQAMSSQASGMGAAFLPKQTQLLPGLHDLHVRCQVRCVTGSQQQVIACVACHAAWSWCHAVLVDYLCLAQHISAGVAQDLLPLLS